MFSNLIIFLCFTFPFIALSEIDTRFDFQSLDLPNTSRGPEAIAFDAFGRGPYTGIADGRVVRFDGSTFREIYITSPNRSNSVCDGTDDPARLRLTCGRPTGLGFYYKEKKLYVADAYRGLLVAGAEDKLALPVTNDTSDGIQFTDGLDVDQLTGDVYYTLASTRFPLSEIQIAAAANDSTGKLLKYKHRSKQVIELLSNLSGPAGTALSFDRSYVLVSEFISKRITKFWLTGPRAFTSQVIVTFQGRPDNIKRTVVGDYWVAVTEMSPEGINLPKAIRIDGNGRVLRTLDLSKYYYNMSISEFQQRGLSRFYIGSLEADFLGVII